MEKLDPTKKQDFMLINVSLHNVKSQACIMYGGYNQVVQEILFPNKTPAWLVNSRCVKWCFNMGRLEGIAIALYATGLMKNPHSNRVRNHEYICRHPKRMEVLMKHMKSQNEFAKTA